MEVKFKTAWNKEAISIRQLVKQDLNKYVHNIDSLMQDCSKPSALAMLAMELLQSCTKPSINVFAGHQCLCRHHKCINIELQIILKKKKHRPADPVRKWPIYNITVACKMTYV